MSANSMPGDDSGLAQLNAVLRARGYIARPLDFGDLNCQDVDAAADADRPTSKSGAPSREHSRKRSRVKEFADIITSILADSTRDLEAKTALAARVRVLEASLARQQKALALQEEDLMVAQKQAAGAQAQVESITSSWSSEKAAHKTTQDDLTKLKRDLGGVRLLASQAKHAAERRADLLKSKLSDVTIQTLLAKGCAADLRVVGGSFDLPGSGSPRPCASLASEQVAALEEDRSSLLAELTAVKLFATECVNALRATGLQLAKQVQIEQELTSPSTYGKAGGKHSVSKSTGPALLSRTTAEPAFVGDIFPALVRYASNDNQDHPATKALQQATEELEHQAAKLALLSTERVEQEQRLRLRSKTEAGSMPSEAGPEATKSAPVPPAHDEGLRQSLASAQTLERHDKHPACELVKAKERTAQPPAPLKPDRPRKATGQEPAVLDAPSLELAPQPKAHRALEKGPNMSSNRHVNHAQKSTGSTPVASTDGQDGDTTPKEPPPDSRIAGGSTTPSVEGTVIDYGSEDERAEAALGPRHGMKRKAEGDLVIEPDDRTAPGVQALGSTRRVSRRLSRLEEVNAPTPFAGGGRSANLAGPLESTPMPRRAKKNESDVPIGLGQPGRRAGALGGRHGSGLGSGRRKGSG